MRIQELVDCKMRNSVRKCGHWEARKSKTVLYERGIFHYNTLMFVVNEAKKTYDVFLRKEKSVSDIQGINKLARYAESKGYRLEV